MKRRRLALRSPRPRREVLIPPRRLRAAASTVAGVVIAGVLVAAALTCDPAASDSFRLPKLLLAETLGLASLWVLLLSALLAPGEETPFRPTTALLAVAPLWLAATLSVVASNHPEAARDSLWHLTIGAACLVGWSGGLERRRLRQLLDFSLLPAAGLAVVGLLQAAGLYQPFPLLVPPEARFEMTSLAGNVGDLAAHLVLPSLLALLGCLDRRGWRRAGYGALLGLFVVTLLLSRTLTALAALTLGALAIAAARLDRRRLVRFGAAVGLALALGALAIPGLGERLRHGAHSAARGDLNIALTGRLDAWRAAVWMFQSRPLTGVGVGSFAAEFPAARLAQLAASGGRGRRSNAYFDTAHNDYLQWVGESGIPGVLTLMWALGVVGWAALRRRGVRGREEAGDWALTGGGLVALAVLALTSFPYHLASTAYPALLFLAWLLADEPQPAGTAQGTPRLWLRRSVLASGLLALTVAIGFEIRRAADRRQADRILALVEASTTEARARGDVPAALLRRNLAALERAERRDPASASIRLAKGSQHLLLRQPEAAMRAYLDALRLEARPEIRLNLGRTQLMLGRNAEARDNFALAVLLEPDLEREIPVLP